MARDLPVRHSDLGHGLVGYALVPVMAVLRIVFAACSILFHRLETRVKFTARGYPKNYVAVVTKPAAAGNPADQVRGDPLLARPVTAPEPS